MNILRFYAQAIREDREEGNLNGADKYDEDDDDHEFKLLSATSSEDDDGDEDYDDSDYDDFADEIDDDYDDLDVDGRGRRCTFFFIFYFQPNLRFF